MSTVFYDKFIVLTKVDKKIKKLVDSNEERLELWQTVEEIIHHKILGCCLTHLPKEHHHEFLERFHQAPYDESLLDFLSLKSNKDIKKIIKQEIKLLANEIEKELG